MSLDIVNGILGQAIDRCAAEKLATDSKGLSRPCSSGTAQSIALLSESISWCDARRIQTYDHLASRCAGPDFTRFTADSQAQAAPKHLPGRQVRSLSALILGPEIACSQRRLDLLTSDFFRS